MHEGLSPHVFYNGPIHEHMKLMGVLKGVYGVLKETSGALKE